MHQITQKKNRALLTALLVYACIVIFISLGHLGPVYLSDEIGYAAKAAHLSGQSNLLSSSWHAGYSIAMAPLFKLFGIGEAAWRSIAILNLLLLILSVIFWLSTLRKLGISTKKASWISISSLACYGVWGFTGWLFVNPMMQLVIAMLSRLLLIEKTRLKIMAIAATGGLSYWVHPTGALIAGSAWLAALLNAVLSSNRQAEKRISITKMISLIAGMLLTLAIMLLYQQVHSAINISMGGDGGHYSKQVSGYIAAFTEETVKTGLEVCTGFINGIANLSIATFGYSSLLVTSLLHAPSGSSLETERSKTLTIQTFIVLLTTCLLLFSAALSINMENNYQHMLHQRYISPMIQSLWILGVASCMADESFKNLNRRIVVSTAPVFLAIVIGSIMWDYDKTFSLVDLMSSGSSVIAHRIGSQQEALSGLGIGTLIIIATQALAPYPKVILAGVIASMVGFESNVMRSRGVQDGSTQLALVRKANRMEGDHNICLAAARTPLAASESDNIYEFYLSSPDIKRIINRYEDRSEFNSFFNSNASKCAYIVAPLDLAFRNSRSDVRPAIQKLSKCHLAFVDDKNGWGLYRCLDKMNALKEGNSKGFTTISDNIATGPLPTTTTPLLVYRGKAFRHEKNHISYARIAEEGLTYLPDPCKSFSNNKERRLCIKNKSFIVSEKSSVPLLWGIYIDKLKPGSYRLLIQGLKVLKGSVTIEIVDARTKRLTSTPFTADSDVSLFEFSIPADGQPVEIRLAATKGTIFRNPSHIIISN